MAVCVWQCYGSCYYTALVKLLAPLFLVISVALTALAVSMFLPAFVGLYFNTGNTSEFIYSALICLASAAVFWAVGMLYRTPHLLTRQMFMITGGTWLIMPVFATLPLMLTRSELSLADLIFETVSGLTTTGSTILSNLDAMPQDVLLWRSLLNWLGGIGIICMAVAILPFLKVGGMRLFQTESSHWSDDNAPRAQQLVKSIIYIYIGLTALCAVAYYLSGMSGLDAFNHALSTLSTGGFSTTDQSFSERSLVTQWVAIIFMLSGAVPFVLYVYFFSGSKRTMLNDSQVRGLLVIIAFVSISIALQRFYTGSGDFFATFTKSAFNVTSIITTTGFASADYSQWGNFTVCILFFATFIGGCSGSTSGGTKIFRLQLFLNLFREQLLRLVHPRLSATRKYNNQVVGPEVITAITAYIFVLITSLVILALGLALTDLDLITSLTGAATALMNVGPGLGDVIGPAGNFSSLTDSAKWMLSIGMILGRLEFLTILILLTPSYWRA